MVRLCSADNWRRDRRFAEHPGKRDLSAGNAALLGNPSHAVDDCVVHFFGLRVQAFPELVGFIALGAFGLPGAGQAAARQGTPGNDADAFGLAKRNHLALFFAIEQVVVILHGNKTGPAVQFGEIERLGELPGVHGRGADIAHLARFHHVVQRLESFLDRRFVIPAMNLVEVHIVGLQTAEALVEFEKDRLAGEAAAIGLVAHDAVELGGDDDGFAAGVCFQESPENVFAFAARIDIGGVKKIDPEFEGLAKEGLAFLFAKRPGVAAGFEFARGRRSIGHAAETDAGNFEAGLTEIDVVHYFSSTLLQIALEQRAGSYRSK